MSTHLKNGMTTDDTGQPVPWWFDIYLRKESQRAEEFGICSCENRLQLTAVCVKSTSPVTENHYKNGYVTYKNFIMTNVDINSDTKYTIKNDTDNHNTRELHE